MAKDKNNDSFLPTNDAVEKFDMLYPMLVTDISEIRELSKKKQDEPLNKFKVKIINQKLEHIKEILSNEPTSQYLELLDDNSLPTNSDALLMMSQFEAAMKQFKKKYYIDYSWKTK